MNLTLLIDWLGSGGKPVSQALADERGAVCEICVENKEGKWWETAKDAIAEAIKRTLAFKNEHGYKVSMEENLNICRICGCCTRLKIWVPKETIDQRIKDVSPFPENCWIRRERTTQ